MNKNIAASKMTEITNKTPLVFLPGWGFKASVWEPVADQFSDRPVHFVNLPVIDDIDLHSFKSITAVLNNQIPVNAVLIAWSLSGLFAIQLCRDYPEKYRSLILAASSPRFLAGANFPGISLDQKNDFLGRASENLPALTKYFLRLCCFPGCCPRLMNELKTQSISEKRSLNFYLEILFNTDLRKTLEKLELPILQLSGKNDAILPIQDFSCPRINLPGGHAFFMKHPDITASILKEFLYADSKPKS